MIIHPKIPISTALVLIIMLCQAESPSASSPQPDELWNKAVTIAGDNENWTPGKAISKTEIRTMDGEIQSVEETEIHIFQGIDGSIQQEVIRSTVNGEDQTDKAKTTAEKQKSQESKNKESQGHSMSIGSGDEGIFNASNQDQLTVNRLAVTESLGGKSVVPYTFVMTKNQKEKLAGKAWLETATGAPIRIDFDPEPLPDGLHSMHQTIIFSFKDKSIWQSTEVNIDGVGGFLFIKRQFHTVIKFSDYWQAPPSPKPVE